MAELESWYEPGSAKWVRIGEEVGSGGDSFGYENTGETDKETRGELELDVGNEGSIRTPSPAKYACEDIVFAVVLTTSLTFS